MYIEEEGNQNKNVLNIAEEAKEDKDEEITSFSLSIIIETCLCHGHDYHYQKLHKLFSIQL